MAYSREDPEMHWFLPKKRGILPLEAFHVSQSLRKLLRKQPFEIRVSTAFPQVIRACAETEGNLHRSRDDSWINPPIIAIYDQLWEMGHAHSIECWQDGQLVGGLYGVSLCGVFFGESMFSRVPNASKVALVHLVERLRAAGYTLLDTQFVNKHLSQFGAVDIPHEDYMVKLESALAQVPNPSEKFLSAKTAKTQ